VRRRDFVFAGIAFPLVTPGYKLNFPFDHGAHPDYRQEWWYVTGWLKTARGEDLGFQVTFFRARPDIETANPSSFTPRQIILAHAALADPKHGRLRHDERAARTALGLAGSAQETTRVWADDWKLELAADSYKARVFARDFSLDLEFEVKDKPLLQGNQGFSRKGNSPEEASYYYSRPQLSVRGAANGQPVPGTLDEVTSGILWFGLQFATQTTSLEGGWKLGDRLANAASSWDAWRKQRPDAGLHVWNEPGAGMPKAKSRALLPRRIRLELEFERPREAQRRTRLSEILPLEGNTMLVEDPDRLPKSSGAFVKLDGEWLRLGGNSGRTVSVQRGMRGTQAANHERGTRLHFGESYVREIPIRLSQEDWDL